MPSVSGSASAFLRKSETTCSIINIREVFSPYPWYHSIRSNIGGGQVSGLDIVLRVRRFVFIGLGCISLALGVIGYILPGLPGTIWLIIAAAFFVRSSPKLYNLVTTNKYFGKQVKEYLETGGMPLRAKIISMVAIWVFTLLSVFVGPYGLLFDVPILGLAALGSLFIASRKTIRRAS